MILLPFYRLMFGKIQSLKRFDQSRAVDFIVISLLFIINTVEMCVTNQKKANKRLHYYVFSIVTPTLKILYIFTSLRVPRMCSRKLKFRPASACFSRSPQLRTTHGSKRGHCRSGICNYLMHIYCINYFPPFTVQIIVTVVKLTRKRNKIIKLFIFQVLLDAVGRF